MFGIAANAGGEFGVRDGGGEDVASRSRHGRFAGSDPQRPGLPEKEMDSWLSRTRKPGI